MAEENLIKVFVVAGVVIQQDGKYLLVQQKQPDDYGLWNLPAGRAEVGDTVKQTALKEAKEETGFDVELIRQLGIFHKDGDKAVKHAFEAKIVKGELSFPEDELLDAKWFTYDEIVAMRDNLRASWVLDAIDLSRKATIR
jgi:ADP-ribose pyrophosphatase YjhB (NUDIX family)